MRVNELARELEITSKELLEELRDNGVEVKNHASNLTVEQVKLAKELYGVEEEETAPAPEAGPEAAPAVDAGPEPEAAPARHAPPRQWKRLASGSVSSGNSARTKSPFGSG